MLQLKLILSQIVANIFKLKFLFNLYILFDISFIWILEIVLVNHANINNNHYNQLNKTPNGWQPDAISPLYFQIPHKIIMFNFILSVQRSVFSLQLFWNSTIVPL